MDVSFSQIHHYFSSSNFERLQSASVCWPLQNDITCSIMLNQFSSLKVHACTIIVWAILVVIVSHERQGPSISSNALSHVEVLAKSQILSRYQFYPMDVHGFVRKSLVVQCCLKSCLSGFIHGFELNYKSIWSTKSSCNSEANQSTPSLSFQLRHELPTTGSTSLKSSFRDFTSSIMNHEASHCRVFDANKH